MLLSLFWAGHPGDGALTVFGRGRGDAALTVLSRIPGRWCSHCFGQDTREMVLSLFLSRIPRDAALTVLSRIPRDAALTVLSRIPRDAALTVSGLDLERCCSHCT
jgi:hypothetical protein